MWGSDLNPGDPQAAPPGGFNSFIRPDAHFHSVGPPSSENSHAMNGAPVVDRALPSDTLPVAADTVSNVTESSLASNDGAQSVGNQFASASSLTPPLHGFAAPQQTDLANQSSAASMHIGAAASTTSAPNGMAAFADEASTALSGGSAVVAMPTMPTTDVAHTSKGTPAADIHPGATPSGTPQAGAAMVKSSLGGWPSGGSMGNVAQSMNSNAILTGGMQDDDMSSMHLHRELQHRLQRQHQQQQQMQMQMQRQQQQQKMWMQGGGANATHNNQGMMFQGDPSAAQQQQVPYQGMYAVDATGQRVPIMNRMQQGDVSVGANCYGAGRGMGMPATQQQMYMYQQHMQMQQQRQMMMQQQYEQQQKQQQQQQQLQQQQQQQQQQQPQQQAQQQQQVPPQQQPVVAPVTDDNSASLSSTTTAPAAQPARKSQNPPHLALQLALQQQEKEEQQLREQMSSADMLSQHHHHYQGHFGPPAMAGGMQGSMQGMMHGMQGAGTMHPSMQGNMSGGMQMGMHAGMHGSMQGMQGGMPVGMQGGMPGGAAPVDQHQYAMMMQQRQMQMQQQQQHHMHLLQKQQHLQQQLQQEQMQQNMMDPTKVSAAQMHAGAGVATMQDQALRPGAVQAGVKGGMPASGQPMGGYPPQGKFSSFPEAGGMVRSGHMMIDSSKQTMPGGGNVMGQNGAGVYARQEAGRHQGSLWDGGGHSVGESTRRHNGALERSNSDAARPSRKPNNHAWAESGDGVEGTMEEDDDDDTDDENSIQWFVDMPGKRSEKLNQIYMAVYMYDPKRNVSVRVDDTGLYFVQGRQETTANAYWALIEAGSWSSCRRWESIDKRKVMSREERRTGFVWLEFDGIETVAEFAEKEWEVALRTKQSGAIYRLRTGNVTRAAPPRGFRRVGLQELETLDSKVVWEGKWDWSGGGNRLNWMSHSKKGPTYMMETSLSGRSSPVVMRGAGGSRDKARKRKKAPRDDDDDEYMPSSRPPLPRSRKSGAGTRSNNGPAGFITRGPSAPTPPPASSTARGSSAGSIGGDGFSSMSPDSASYNNQGVVKPESVPSRRVCGEKETIDTSSSSSTATTTGEKRSERVLNKNRAAASRSDTMEKMENSAKGLLALAQLNGVTKVHQNGVTKANQHQPAGVDRAGQVHANQWSKKNKQSDESRKKPRYQDDVATVGYGKSARTSSAGGVSGSAVRSRGTPVSESGEGDGVLESVEAGEDLAMCVCRRVCEEGKKGVLQCVKCSRLVHAGCVNVASVASVSASWMCAQCTSAQASKKRKAATQAQETSAAAAREARKKAKKLMEIESAELEKKLAQQGLCLIEIPSDGHCLFSAISDQLRRSAGKGVHVPGLTHRALRKMAAEYMLQHEEQFKEFLSLQKESFESYCRRVERTAAWGGQHELVALCRVLKRNIVVFRHDMPKQQQFPDPATDEPYEGSPLRLSYHMHTESGGEHYNSVVSIKEKNGRRRREYFDHRTDEQASLEASIHSAEDKCDDMSDRDGSSQTYDGHDSAARADVLNEDGDVEEDDAVWKSKSIYPKSMYTKSMYGKDVDVYNNEGDDADEFGEGARFVRSERDDDDDDDMERVEDDNCLEKDLDDNDDEIGVVELDEEQLDAEQFFVKEVPRAADAESACDATGIMPVSSNASLNEAVGAHEEAEGGGEGGVERGGGAGGGVGEGGAPEAGGEGGGGDFDLRKGQEGGERGEEEGVERIESTETGSSEGTSKSC